MHRGAVQRKDGQAQFKAALCLAVNGCLVERLAGEVVERRALHKTQQFGAWPLHLGAGLQHRVHQVGDLDGTLAQAQVGRLFERGLQPREAQGSAVQQQLGFDAAQGGPGTVARRLQVGRHVAEAHILQAGRDAELALGAGQVVGQVPEVATDAKVHRTHLALAHGLAHIAARVGANGDGQVVVHLLGAAAREAGGEVEHARKAGAAGAAGWVAGVPVDRAGAFGVCIGQAELVQPDVDAFGIQPPSRLGTQAFERDAGALEDAGQVEHPVGNGEAGLAAVFAQLEVAAEPLDAGAPERRTFGAGRCLSRQRLEVQAHHTTAGSVALRPPGGMGLGWRCGGGHWRAVGGLLEGRRQALKAQPQAFNLATGLQRSEPLAGLIGQGRAHEERGQGVEVDPVDLQLGGSGLIALRCLVPEQALPRRPVQPLGGAQAQGLRLDLQPLFVPAAAEPTAEFGQGEFGQTRLQAGLQACEGHVGGGAGDLTARHIDPGLQAALAAAHFHHRIGQGQVLAQLRHIDLRKIGIDLARPALPGARIGAQLRQPDERLAQLRTQAKARAPVGGGGGVQPKLVLTAAVAGHKIKLRQRQCRLATQLVGPADGAAPDGEFTLGEKPLGAAAFFRGVGKQVQPSDLDPPGGVAPYVEHGGIDDDLLKAQAPERQG